MTVRFGPGELFRGANALWLSLLSLGVAAVLALVVPITGFCRMDSHELMLVHPVFAHEHDPHAEHRAALGEPKPPLAPSATMAPASDFGAGLALAFESLLAATPPTVMGLALSLVLVQAATRRPRGLCVPVPTGPPR